MLRQSHSPGFLPRAGRWEHQGTTRPRYRRYPSVIRSRGNFHLETIWLLRSRTRRCHSPCRSREDAEYPTGTCTRTPRSSPCTPVGTDIQTVITSAQQLCSVHEYMNPVRRRGDRELFSVLLYSTTVPCEARPLARQFGFIIDFRVQRRVPQCHNAT